MPYYDHKTVKYRLFDVRYADDWILLTNASIPVVRKMKRRIKDFLFFILTRSTFIRGKDPDYASGFQMRTFFRV